MTDASKLADGFYWVRPKGKAWTIALKEDDSGVWFVAAHGWFVRPEIFDEIDPTPITREAK